jgi:hypothetical protein
MTKTLTLSDIEARQIYSTAPSELKRILESTFTKAFFSQSLLERCTSFEAVCAERGVNPFDIYSTDDKPHIAAIKRLEFAIEVINDDPNFPNWDDSDQYKWFPWFYHNSPAGFRFYASNYGDAGSRVGSRFVLKSEDRVQHMVKYFFADYKALHTKS